MMLRRSPKKGMASAMTCVRDRWVSAKSFAQTRTPHTYKGEGTFYGENGNPDGPSLEGVDVTMPRTTQQPSMHKLGDDVSIDGSRDEDDGNGEAKDDALQYARVREDGGRLDVVAYEAEDEGARDDVDEYLGGADEGD